MKKIVIMILALMAVMPMCAQETAEQKDARRRAFIDDFLATYEAAYEKKEIEYIKNFFSDDALIITETKKLKPTGSKETIPSTRKTRPYAMVVENRVE